MGNLSDNESEEEDSFLSDNEEESGLPGSSETGSESPVGQVEILHDDAVPRRRPHQPCPADLVAQLPRIAYSPQLFSGEPYQEACPICMENFDPSESDATDHQIVLTPCLHAFHEPCLSSWLRKHVECPSCRWDVTNTGEVALHNLKKLAPLPALFTPADLVGQTVVL